MPRMLSALAPPDCTTTLCAARCVHDDGDADQADEGSGDVPSVWPESVEGHAPGEGSGDEDAAVGGEDPAEVCVGLQRRDEAVDTERDDLGRGLPWANESAGRIKSTKTRDGNRNLKGSLGIAALSTARSRDTYFAAKYRRI
jgi:hypothetical protein